MAKVESNQVRIGVIGLGNIGQTHCDMLRGAGVPRAVLAAVASPTLTPEQARAFPVPHFTDGLELIKSGLVDAVLIASPTHNHLALGKLVLQAGLHLLMEKPLAMSVGQAQELLSAQVAESKFAVMLNQRFHPYYAEIKKLVDNQAIGQLTRVAWTMTAWYRPDIYYQVSRWRGTWPGEGGGLLINQCIHNLDVLQWITGLPTQVSAVAGFGKFHDIEVEDEVTATLIYPDGMTGVLVASSGEAPGVNQLDLVGDRGMLRFDGVDLKLWRSDGSVSEHCQETSEMFGMPQFQQTQIEPEEPAATNAQHAAVVKNFVDAILDDVALQTPAEQGIASLQLANGMLFSAWSKQPVDLPIDAPAYEKLLQNHIAQGALREPSLRTAKIDMDASYR